MTSVVKAFIKKKKKKGNVRILLKTGIENTTSDL